MAEQTSEQLSQTPSFEQSRIAAVLAVTIEATKKITSAIGKVAGEVLSMIFK